jgi:hypothetical protein
MRDPEAIQVMAYAPEWSPERMFVALLAQPWYQPELPFPGCGAILDERAVGELAASVGLWGPR